MQTFEQLQAEYEAAKEARDEAERRLTASYNALQAARCGFRWDAVPVNGGRLLYRSCTLERGHDGAHKN